MHNQSYTILVINPGSTSTKVAVYQDEEVIFAESHSHTNEEFNGCRRILDQLDIRRRVVENALIRHGIDVSSLSAVACRGGRLKPVESGTYLVNERMLNDARRGLQEEHASNLGCLIGYEIAQLAKIEAFVVDPVSVDELDDVARISGLREIQRNSLSHALNMKAVARRAAADLELSYDRSRIIVAHVGGGGSVSAHAGGRMVDIYNSDKEGPFTAERAGAIPTLDLVDLCFSGRYTKDEVIKMLVGGGGLMSHLGTKDAKEIEQRIDAGDPHARLIFDAMVYAFSKAVGAMCPVLFGDVDVIAITGGLAHSKRLVEGLKSRVGFIAPIRVYPGEDELQALALGVLRVLRNEEMPRIYE
jgi:butyrate kinase